MFDWQTLAVLIDSQGQEKNAWSFSLQRTLTIQSTRPTMFDRRTVAVPINSRGQEKNLGVVQPSANACPTTQFTRLTGFHWQTLAVPFNSRGQPCLIGKRLPYRSIHETNRV